MSEIISPQIDMPPVVGVPRQRGASTLLASEPEQAVRPEPEVRPEPVVVPELRPAAGTRIKPRRPAWSIRYRRTVVICDSLMIALGVGISLLPNFGDDAGSARVGYTRLTYSTFAVVLALVWLSLLWCFGAWDRKVLASSTSEYKRVVNATALLFGAVAIISYLGRAEIARGYIATVLPLGLFGLLVARVTCRVWLQRRRSRGRMLARVLVVGGHARASELALHLSKTPSSGYKVTGICLPVTEQRAFTADSRDTVEGGFPVLGDVDDLSAVIDRAEANVVAVVAADALSSMSLRRLSWDLEGTGIRLVIAPGVSDVAGPRMHIKPVAGLPLLQVDEPRFRGPKLVAKTLMDYVGAGVLLAVSSPVFLAIALVIKVSDPGPVFFRQVRVGKRGRAFRIYKFRSMVTGAERQVDAVKAMAGQTNSVFYKSADDSRITSVGRLLRKTSLDELPQLLNVLKGDMSLIGPRPLVPGEGAEVDRFLERRMLVKPGLTGLWQVSGRSDLSGDDRIRLDFYYVENWSVTGDFAILLKTLRTVLARTGAY